jgi:prepilin-type N-terminal cleavage/methylation domain-containing protein
MKRRPCFGATREHGFTLVELVVVIILVGILAAFAMPRFTNKPFDERGFHDVAKAALQHARHVAIATRRYVCATTSAGSGTAGMLTFSIDTALPEANSATVDCASALALPMAGDACSPVVANRVCAPAGISLSGDSVIFDPRGVPVTAAKALEAALALIITGEASTTIAIAAETGWIE